MNELMTMIMNFDNSYCGSGKYSYNDNDGGGDDHDRDSID